MRKKYFTEEERKEAEKLLNRARNKRYVQKHKSKLKLYYQEHKEEIDEWRKQWRKTPMGRACRLASCYKRSDEKYNRGECTINGKWIVENIFSKPCHYCGETDWRKIGCDRIDNDLPHTPDNVVPCCKACNDKRQKKIYDEFKKELGIA